MEPLGFDAFACGVVDLDERDRCVFYLIDWPDDWRRFYMSSGLLEHDPVVGALQHRTDVFTWSDLRADRKFAEAGREALERVATEGWKDGLVVPVPLSERRIGIVSLSGPDPIVTPDARAYIGVLATQMHGHVRAMMPRHGFARAPAGLTDREIACVRLVAHGLSDTAIARALHIAPSTAHEFVEKAKARLKARSRVTLVAIAIELGIVSA